MFMVHSDVKQTDSRIEPDSDYAVVKVRNDRNGYPHFLIWSEKANEWIWKSAKHFHM